MAIPTQFSVANNISAPVANPSQPVDDANPLTAEDVGFISGASALPAKSAGGFDNASLFNALSVGTINNPSLVSAEAVAPVDNASLLSAQSQAALPAPSVANSEAQPSMPAPSALIPKAGTLTSPPFPLNHARILYENLLVGSVSSTVPSSTPELALVPNTWQKWQYTDGNEQSWAIQVSTSAPMDTFCIGAHNIYSPPFNTPRLKIEYSTGSTSPFIEVYSEFITSSAPVFVHLPSPVTVKRVKVTIGASASRSKYIGYISAGIALQMQRPFFNGHRPFNDSDVTEYYASRTESGERIGRQIRRKGFETSFEWSNLDDGWYRQYIPEFKEFAKRVPVFLAWNLLEYPEDVAFGDITEDFGASMQNGTATKRSGLSFTIAGVG